MCPHCLYKLCNTNIYSIYIYCRVRQGVDLVIVRETEACMRCMYAYDISDLLKLIKLMHILYTLRSYYTSVRQYTTSNHRCQLSEPPNLRCGDQRRPEYTHMCIPHPKGSITSGSISRCHTGSV